MVSLHERLLNHLTYDPETGWFTYNHAGRRARVGGRAGWLSPDGYRYLRFEARVHGEHRWVVFYMTGIWPTDQVDHKRVGKEFRSDNRWGEIRVATRAQNGANRVVQNNSSSGAKGVSRASKNRWYARVGGDRTYLGCFASKEDATNAVALEARRRYGEFART